MDKKEVLLFQILVKGLRTGNEIVSFSVNLARILSGVHSEVVSGEVMSYLKLMTLPESVKETDYMQEIGPKLHAVLDEISGNIPGRYIKMVFHKVTLNPLTLEDRAGKDGSVTVDKEELPSFNFPKAPRKKLN